MVGRTVAHYRIVEALGAGGMGVVYKAEDMRLGRPVALKFLPEHLSGDRMALERFQREARAASALNHPYICTIHDIDEVDGRPFIAMELLEGETLRARLAIARLAFPMIIDLGVQLADALEAAHANGIVHRDIKPENIFITTRGTAKLLDFGIAKLVTEQAAATGVLPVTGGATGPVPLGTLAYMSPEQARAEGLDGRTDLFSFGVVLYEMATGVQPFGGLTQASVLARILTESPLAPGRLNGDLPAEIEPIIDKLLEKDRELRYQSARDLRVDLQRLRRRLAGATRGAPGTPSAQALTDRPLTSHEQSSEPQPAPARFSIALPPDAPLALDRGLLPFALAPDGRRLVYVARIRSGTQLFIREISEPSPRPIPGTEGARSPFFSPDGNWIGYMTGGSLCKVPVAGGRPAIVCEAGWMIGGADWSDAGILFNGSFLSKPGIWLVEPDGGAPRLMVPGGPGASPSWPQLLPGGKAILLSMLLPGTTYKARVEIFSLETQTSTTLIEGGAYHARYLPSGHLLYAKAGQLFVAPFDLERHVISGDALPVLREAFIDEPIGWVANYAVSRTGTVAYLDRRAEGIERALMWIGLDGSIERLPAAPGSPLFPRLSPDGRLLAATIVRGDDYNVHLFDLRRGVWARVTREGHNDLPIWAPDGKSVTFTSDRGSIADHWHVFRARLDGSGVERLAERKDEGVEGLNELATSWHPGGETLLYLELPSGACRYASLHGGRWQARTLVEIPGCAVFESRFSPDGRLVAYTVVDESTSHVEVFIVPYCDPGEAIQVSSDGGIDPVWAPDGSRLFYRHGSSQMMAVTIRTAPTVEVGAPELLFEGPALGATWLDYRSYDVARDGSRFVASGKVSEPGRLEVVVNWFEELKPRNRRSADAS